MNLQSSRLLPFLWIISWMTTCALVVVVATGGCGRRGGSEVMLTWSNLVAQLAQPEGIARLDAPPTTLIASYDPTGGNDDYNHCVRPGPPGWVVLADLKGPGYLSRFWMTGIEDGKHRLQFFFDGESAPRIDTTVGAWCGGEPPFLPPLAANENFCWYSYVPVPYAKRLIVMAQAGGYKPDGWPRLFYQINYSALPKGQRVQSLTWPLPEADQTLLASVRQRWQSNAFDDVSPSAQVQQDAFSLDPGARHECPPLPGPGLVRRLAVSWQPATHLSATARDRLLRELVLRIRWDEAAAPSVEVPLGDFFGSVWHPLRYQSQFFGLTNDTGVCRFPMPFRAAAHVGFENQGTNTVALTVDVTYEPRTNWAEGWGYFHAAWNRSGPEDVGRPHDIARVTGRGRLAACLLGVTSADKSWWILEGDETMRIDGDTAPRWHGTGLEDYFNGGWYYQNALPRPLHGMVCKTFFHTLQYRVHLPDAVRFDRSLEMQFERGPDHASHGWMESMAYYYLERPAPAWRPLGAPPRDPPRDPMAEITLMPELFNVEKLGDAQGARALIAAWLETHPAFEYASVLRLRQLAYTIGHDSAADRTALAQFAAAETNPTALAQAQLLRWFADDPTHALVSLYCNTRARVFLDDQQILEGQQPERLAITGVTLTPGRHVLSVQAQFHPYPDWVQVCLRTRQGDLATGPDWKYSFQATGHWTSAAYDDSAWSVLGGMGVKGPPEEPFIWVEPNAFAGMQSAGVGIRPTREWPEKKGVVTYRKVFVTPNPEP